MQADRGKARADSAGPRIFAQFALPGGAGVTPRVPPRSTAARRARLASLRNGARLKPSTQHCVEVHAQPIVFNDYSRWILGIYAFKPYRHLSRISVISILDQLDYCDRFVADQFLANEIDQPRTNAHPRRLRLRLTLVGRGRAAYLLLGA